MTKRANNIRRLAREQREALDKFSADLQAALPQMQATAKAARDMHQAMLNAPQWGVVEAPRPQQLPEEKLFSVGHAQVNYVDHIKTSIESDDSEGNPK